MIRTTIATGLFAAGAGLVGFAVAQSPSKPLSEPKKALTSTASDASPAGTSDVELVERALAARKEYDASLRKLYEHYARIGDKRRTQWVEQEIHGYHLLFKPSYNLDVQDVPPPSLEAKVNVRDANDLFRQAMEFKGRGFGDDYILNQRRTEMLLREILEKYPNCDKIADVAYQLAELYESKAYKQLDRAARYYERSFQWKKGSTTDARLKAAILYDKSLNERSKALELYRDVIAHDTDPERLKQAERRLGELTGGKK
jgi:hypothetical protein